MCRAGGNMCRAGGMCAAQEVFCGVCAAQEVIMFRVGGMCGVCVPQQVCTYGPPYVTENSCTEQKTAARNRRLLREFLLYRAARRQYRAAGLCAAQQVCGGNMQDRR